MHIFKIAPTQSITLFICYTDAPTTAKGWDGWTLMAVDVNSTPRMQDSIFGSNTAYKFHKENWVNL